MAFPFVTALEMIRKVDKEVFLNDLCYLKENVQVLYYQQAVPGRSSLSGTVI